MKQIIIIPQKIIDKASKILELPFIKSELKQVQGGKVEFITFSGDIEGFQYTWMGTIKTLHSLIHSHEGTWKANTVLQSPEDALSEVITTWMKIEKNGRIIKKARTVSY